MNLEELITKKDIPKLMQRIGWERNTSEKITFERIENEKVGVINAKETGTAYIIEYSLYQEEELTQHKRYFSKKIGPASRWIIRFASMSDKYFTDIQDH